MRGFIICCFLGDDGYKKYNMGTPEGDHEN